MPGTCSWSIVVTMISPLYFKWNIAELCIPNRIVMAPMSTNLVDVSGGVTCALKNFLVRRAIGGCGMIILEAATVDSTKGGTGLNLRLDCDKCRPGLRDIIHQSHAFGTVVAAQLWHAGPRAYVKDSLPLSPSGTTPGFPVSKEMEITEIKNVVRNFIKAGEQAADIGFDAVVIHAAHGYLLHHFIDATTNRRIDAYGGSIERRYRVLGEICAGLKYKRPRLPVILRISLREEDDLPAVASVIQEIEFDAVDLRTGFSSMPEMVEKVPVPAGYTLHLSKKLRPYLHIPLLTGGRILYPRQAEQVVMEYGVDGVILGRPLLADPDWAKKTFSGEGQTIIPCIYDCEPSCYSRFKEGEPLHCVYYGRKEC